VEEEEKEEEEKEEEEKEEEEKEEEEKEEEKKEEKEEEGWARSKGGMERRRFTTPPPCHVPSPSRTASLEQPRLARARGCMGTRRTQAQTPSSPALPPAPPAMQQHLEQ